MILDKGQIIPKEVTTKKENIRQRVIIIYFYQKI